MEKPCDRCGKIRTHYSRGYCQYCYEILRRTGRFEPNKKQEQKVTK